MVATSADAPAETRPATVEEARAKLAEFFPPHFVRWKPANYKAPAGEVEALAYIDVRAVCDRLDAVFGPDGWETTFRELSGGAIQCTLRVMFPKVCRWVRRTDVGSRSAHMPDPDDNLKTGYSDALKRAAVQLGIGRYLYRMGAGRAQWDGKRITKAPAVPNDFLPPDYRPAGPDLADRAVKAAERLAARRTQADPKNRETAADYVARLLRLVGVDPSVPLASVRTRIVRQIARRAAADLEALDDSDPLPKDYPQDGPSLAIRLGQHDAKLAAKGLCKPGDLLSALADKGRRAGFPGDLRDWNRRSQIRVAVGWATELTDSLGTKPTRDPLPAATPAADPEPAAAV